MFRLTGQSRRFGQLACSTRRQKHAKTLTKYGFWLIGYDGEVKAFSLETNILNEIFNLIDQMPIRQQEMLMYKKKC